MCVHTPMQIYITTQFGLFSKFWYILLNLRLNKKQPVVVWLMTVIFTSQLTPRLFDLWKVLKNKYFKILKMIEMISDLFGFLRKYGHFNSVRGDLNSGQYWSFILWKSTFQLWTCTCQPNQSRYNNANHNNFLWRFDDMKQDVVTWGGL